LPSFCFILLSFTGVVLVITDGRLSDALHGRQDFSADLVIVLGALCWVIYTNGASAFRGWSAYRYTTITTMLGMSSILAINGALFALHVVPVPDLHTMRDVTPYLAYAAAVPGFLGVLSWNVGNKIITPMNGVLFMDVIPLTAFVISALQGVIPSDIQIVGAVCTACAIVLNNFYLRRVSMFASQRKNL
jgi:hypothetical protein